MMRKFIIPWLVFLLVFTLTSCTKDEELIITPESIISMDNLDDYLFRDDVQYVDLRNYESRYKYGYILGFETIPFFDYLDYRAFNRERTYEFNADQLLDTTILLNLFDPDKAIFLYADGCIRSGYVKDALNYLGYERVFVIGGYYEYKGDNVISGDGSFDIGNSFYQYQYDDVLNITYVMYGEFDVAKNVNHIHFDVLDESGKSIRYTTEYNYDAMLTTIEEFITNEIYNFNEIVDDLDDITSEIYQLDNVDWEALQMFVALFEEEYRE